MRHLTQYLAGALGRNFWALADQALIAAASFLAMVLLARQLSVSEFGAFTLVFSLLYFANSMQSGLITQPHNVLGATRRGGDYARYTTTTALAQIALALISALLALAGWMIARFFDADVAPLFVAAAPATVAWQLQEFARRALYTERRLSAAFACDLIGYGGQSLAVALLWRVDALSGTNMFLAMSAACGLSCVLGVWHLRRSLVGRIDLNVLRDNWHFGKWVAGGTILGEWLTAQMLVYIAAAALGAAAAGVLRAVHTLFGPARILAQVFAITLPTRLAVVLENDGSEAFFRYFTRVALLASSTLGTYCLLVVLLAQPLLQLAFGEKYLAYSDVLQLYAVSAFVTYLYQLVAAALRAQRRTRAIFVSELIYLVVLPLGALLIPLWDLSGLVVGLIVGDVAATLYVAAACARNIRQEKASAVEGPMLAPALAEGALP